MRRTAISRLFLVAGVLAVLSSPMVIALDSGEKPEQRVFNLSQISAFDVNGPAHKRFAMGQRTRCSSQPGNDVKAYPVFKSSKPLYGSVRFAFDYVSGDPGIEYHFAIDESSGTDAGYDRLYFDANRDLDLTNDEPKEVLANPPAGAMLEYKSAPQQVCFDYIAVNFVFGSEKQRPLEIMPRLAIPDEGNPGLAFVTTKAHKGQIEIGGRQYDVLLGHNSLIGGWFDRPSTVLNLIPKGDERQQTRSFGANQLRAMHKIAGTYYSFSAIPGGDKLLVRPYEGEFGTLKVGSGWRIILNKGVYGSLLSTKAYLEVGSETKRGQLAPVANCELPVGDYLPAFLTIEYRPLRFTISESPYADGKLDLTSGQPPKCSIRIRKNKPFVLDFSHKPEVQFASPAKDRKIKPGETLRVEAFLVDPELNIMIRNIERRPYPNILSSSSVMTIIALMVPGLLWVSFRRLRKRYRALPIISALGLVVFAGYTIAMYSVNYRLNYDKLEPHVTITGASGEKVAEGMMPFG